MFEYRYSIDQPLDICLISAWEGANRRPEFKHNPPNVILFNPLDAPGREKLTVAGQCLTVQTHKNIPRNTFSLVYLLTILI